MFTMPVSAEAGVVIYREDLITKPPSSHADLLNGAERASSRDISGAVGRGARGLDIVWVWTNFLLSEGGLFFDNGEPAVNSPESVRATEIYVDQLLGSYGPNGVANMGWLEANNYFNEGKAAIYPDASGLVSLTLEEKNMHSDDVAVARWPRGSEGTPAHPNYFYWSIGIPTSSAKQEQAAMFYAWATSPEISMAIGREAGTPVARESVWADQQFREFYPPEIVEEITANYAQVRPGMVPYERPTFPQEVNALSVELVSVLNGKDVKQALDAAASAMALAAR